MKTLARLFVLFTVLFSFSAVSHGQIYHWQLPNSGNWSTSSYWMPNSVPGTSANDTVIIDATGSPYTVTLNISPPIPLVGFTLDSSDAQFEANHRTLTVNGPTLLNDGQVTWQNSIWFGSGTLTNYAEMTIFGNSELRNTSFVQNGSLLVQGDYSNGSAVLTVMNGFDNSGTIALESSHSSRSSTLTVNTGTLTNTSTGTININQGSGGARYLKANLTNEGKFNVNTDFSFAKTGANYINNGQINIATGKTFSVVGNGQIFKQNGGTIDIDGTLRLANIAVFYDGGTILGTPRLENVNFRIGAGATNPASFMLYGSGNELVGDIHTGQQLTVMGDYALGSATLASITDFSNAGTITLNSTHPSRGSVLNLTSGTLTNTITGTINVEQGSGGTRVIQANLANDGTININIDTTFTKSSGVYTNNNLLNIASDKTLTIQSNNQTFNQNNGTLNIDGILRLDRIPVHYNGGTILGTPILENTSLYIGSTATNTASFRLYGTESTLVGDIHAGQLLTVMGDYALGTAQLTSTASYTNAGTITLNSLHASRGSVLNLTNGVLTNDGTININQGSGGLRSVTANLNNRGTINVLANTNFQKDSGAYTNSGTLNIASGKTLSIAAYNQAFSQNDGTLNIDGTLKLSNMAVNYNGGTIVGTPVLNNIDLDIGPAAINSANFLIYGGDNTLTNNVNAGHVLTVMGEYTYGTAQLTSATGFNNAGTITLDSLHPSRSSTLIATTGTITNTQTGTLNFNQGSGGSRTVKADLANLGTINVHANTTFQKTNGVYNNNGLLVIDAGKTLSIGAYSQTLNQNGGALYVNGNLNLTNMSFNFNNGKIFGTPTLHNVTLNIAPTAVNPATFQLYGNSNILTSNVNYGQHLTLTGDYTNGEAILTSPSGFNNAGIINLTSNHPSRGSQLVATSGTLTNIGTININQGSGGTRYIKANLDNEGTINWNTSGSMNKTGSLYLNSGDFNICGSAIVTVQGTSFTNETEGTIAGTGRLNLTTTTFTNDGTVSPGFSAGTLTVIGTYNQSETGLLDIEIGGLTANTEYDRLVVDGTANLDGLLDLSLIDDFVPAPTDTFTILTATQVNGFFSNAETTVYFGGGSFEVQYTATSVVLSNYEAVPEPNTLALLFGILLTTPLLFRRRQNRFTDPTRPQ